MGVSYTDLFLILLAAYSIYSVIVRLDPRYPVAGALLLLVAAAVADAGGSTATANSLAEFCFLLLAAGVLLLLIEHLREARGSPVAIPVDLVPGREVAGEATDPGHRSAEDPFDRLEQQSVPPVDAPGNDHDDEERRGDAED